MWTKSGDFAKPYDSGAPLNRRCDYLNDSESAVISKLFIGGYEDGDYQISAKAPTAEAYTQLQDAVKRAGFPEPCFTDANVQTVRLSTANLNTIKHFLASLRAAEHSFIIIEDDVCRSLALEDLDSSAPLATWNKSGNFSLKSYSNTPLERSCQYDNYAVDAVIRKLFIGGYDDGGYQISAKAPTDDAFQQLKEALKAEEFPESSFSDDYLKTVRISTSDANTLACFLKTLRTVEANLTLITADICNSLFITDLENTHKLATWNKTGNFARTYYYQDDLSNRSVRFATGQKGSLVREFSLIGYKNNTFMFTFTPLEDAPDFMKSLKDLRLRLEFSNYTAIPNNVSFRFGGSEHQNFEELLAILCDHCPQFSEICESFKAEVSNLILAHKTTYDPLESLAPAGRRHSSGVNSFSSFPFQCASLGGELPLLLQPEFDLKLLQLYLILLLARKTSMPTTRPNPLLRIENGDAEGETSNKSQRFFANPKEQQRKRMLEQSNAPGDGRSFMPKASRTPKM